MQPPPPKKKEEVYINFKSKAPQMINEELCYISWGEKKQDCISWLLKLFEVRETLFDIEKWQIFVS